MAMTRISDVIVRGGQPATVALGDVLTDPPPAPLTAAEAIDEQPSHSILLRNALAIEDRLAANRGPA